VDRRSSSAVLKQTPQNFFLSSIWQRIRFKYFIGESSPLAPAFVGSFCNLIFSGVTCYITSVPPPRETFALFIRVVGGALRNNMALARLTTSGWGNRNREWNGDWEWLGSGNCKHGQIMTHTDNAGWDVPWSGVAKSAHLSNMLMDT